MIGGGVSSGLFFLFKHVSSGIRSDKAFEIIIWNVFAGIAAGGLWAPVSPYINGSSGSAFNESYFKWTAGTIWLLVLRLTELIVSRTLRNADDLLGFELLLFIPVLLWSRVIVGRLNREAGKSFRQFFLHSLVYAVVIQWLSALTIFPVALITQSHGGTGEALIVLGLLPGPGILWALVIARVLRPPIPFGNT
jgi:uncharacterized membrane protein